MDKEDKCYFCDKPAIGIYRVCVDAELGEDDNMVGVYGRVGLCAEHRRDYLNREGMFDSSKHGR